MSAHDKMNEKISKESKKGLFRLPLKKGIDPHEVMMSGALVEDWLRDSVYDTEIKLSTASKSAGDLKEDLEQKNLLEIMQKSTLTIDDKTRTLEGVIGSDYVKITDGADGTKGTINNKEISSKFAREILVKYSEVARVLNSKMENIEARRKDNKEKFEIEELQRKEREEDLKKNQDVKNREELYEKDKKEFSEI